MPNPFESLTLKDATALVASVAPDAGALEALDFYRGEAWRGGDGWVGQKPPQGPDYAAQMAQLEASLIAQNVTAEVVQRHRAGILGREPRWGFVPRRPLQQDEQPTADEQALIDEAEAALTQWWDRRKPLHALQAATVTALLAARAPLRLFVPSGLRDEQGRIAVPPAAPDESPLVPALDYLYCEAPDPAVAGVFTDDATRREASVFAFTRYTSAIPGLPPSGQGTALAELAYVDDQGNTVIAVIGGDAPEVSDPLPLRGRLPLYELRREALITAQVRQGQKAINLTLTQMIRNVNLAGSLERIFVNLAPPGKAVNTATGQPWQPGDDPALRRFVPEPLTVGAGVSAFLRGAEVRDKDGNLTGYSNGTVNYRDPVPVDTFTQTRQEFRAAILGEVGQTHALIAGDATASGESRKQARAEFEASLALTKTALDDAGRWLLETALAWAAAFAGQPGRFAGLRCEFGAVVDAGPLTADEQAAIIAQHDKGLVSTETALSDLGRDDVDAELARIAAEQDATTARQDASYARLTQPQRPATAPQGGAGGGTPPDAAQALAAELGRQAA